MAWKSDRWLGAIQGRAQHEPNVPELKVGWCVVGAAALSVHLPPGESSTHRRQPRRRADRPRGHFGRRRQSRSAVGDIAERRGVCISSFACARLRDRSGERLDASRLRPAAPTKPAVPATSGMAALLIKIATGAACWFFANRPELDGQLQPTRTNLELARDAGMALRRAVREGRDREALSRRFGLAAFSVAW